MSSSSDAEEQFQVRRQGRRLGPFSRPQIDRMIARQKLGPKDEIGPAGGNQWQRIDQWQLDQQRPDELGPTIRDATTKDASIPAAGVSKPPQDSAGTGDSDTGDWYIVIDGDRQGPFDEHTLGKWISERRINSETLVWRGGMQDWMPAREALPAALVTSPSVAIANPTPTFVPNVASPARENDSGDGGYALRDLRSRSIFWMLTVCIITYIFTAESFAVGVFQIYTAVATRRVGTSGLVALWAISSMVFASLLMMTAVALTKLLAKQNRRQEDPLAVARHEHRVWLFAGLSMAFIIVNQIVIAILLLFSIAQAT